MNKLNLFNYDEKPPEPRKKITYSSLNIHQKINYKANMGNAFYGSVYRSRYLYFHEIINARRDPYDCLIENYFIEYRLNAGGSNRLQNWKKQNKKTLF